MHPTSRRNVSAAIFGGLMVFAIAAGLLLSRTERAEATSYTIGVAGCNTLQDAWDAAVTNAAVNGCPAGSADDTIQLPSGGPAHALTVVGPINADTSITIQGVPGGAAETIDMNSSAFDLQSTLIFQDVTLTNRGEIYLGSGLDAGVLTFTNVINTDVSAQWGIFVNAGSALNITGSTFSNLVDQGFTNNGGTISIQNSTFSDNGSRIIYNQSGTTTIDQSSFVLNGSGGGSDGGAIANTGGTVTATNSLFDRNAAEDAGGAIANVSSDAPVTLNLTNVTFDGNNANNGSAVYNFANDSSSTSATTNMLNVTVAGSPDEGAIFSGEGVQSAAIAILNMKMVLVVENFEANCIAGEPGDIVSIGFNLSDDATCPVGPGDLSSNLGANLLALANNGGPTMTRALGVGSTAIDAGTNAGGAVPDGPCPATDQRLFPRPIDGDINGTATCDIGAYELQQDVTIPGCPLTPAIGFQTPRCLVIVKETIPDGAVTPFTFNSTVDAPPPGAPVPQQNVISDGQAFGFSLSAAPTVFSITEVVPAGWDLDDISCVLDGFDAPVEVGNNLTLTYDGNQVGPYSFGVCTFTNGQEDNTPTPTPTRTPTRTPTGTRTPVTSTPTRTATSTTATPTATPTLPHFDVFEPRPNVGGIFGPLLTQNNDPNRNQPAPTVVAPAIRPPSTGDGGLQ